ncbi:MAG: hypothetical protein ACI3U8_07415 [Candidatus Onthomonas sp.]
MNYCDCDRYPYYGGLLDEDDDRIYLWTERASRVIDRITLGRAAEYAYELSNELADACARIADLLVVQENARRSSAWGALTSASNDGYSESYAAVSGSDTDAQARAILADCLGDDRYGLLYRGVPLC